MRTGWWRRSRADAPGEPMQLLGSPSYGASPKSALNPPLIRDTTAQLEIQHKDSNYALFQVLMECCNVIANLGSENDVPGVIAVIYAKNVLESGKTEMTNGEIAECAYRLAGELHAVTDPRAETVKQMLRHLVLADRWEAKLRENSPYLGRK